MLDDGMRGRFLLTDLQTNSSVHITEMDFRIHVMVLGTMTASDDHSKEITESESRVYQTLSEFMRACGMPPSTSFSTPELKKRMVPKELETALELYYGKQKEKALKRELDAGED